MLVLLRSFVVFVFAITSVVGCSSESDKSLPPLERVKSWDSRITEAAELAIPGSEKPVLLISYTKKTIYSGGAWLSDISFFLQKALREVADELPGKYSAVTFSFFMPVVDKYGNESTSRQMTITYSMADIEKVNWHKSTSWMLLNLGVVEFKNLGREAKDEYCSDENNGKYADVFCGQ